MGCCQQPSVGSFLIFKKGDFYDASEKTNPEKQKSRDAYSGFDLSYWQSLLYR
ncbi:hypothetical protein NIA69_17780 [Gemmiger formicilis]|nr:hypothetical protein [Gemmiger formicilis]